MNALLELRDVVKHFPVRDALGRRAGAVHAVDGVSLSVAEGEVLAIVGESGCGKSTLGRVMLRLIEPDSGAVRFAGTGIFSCLDGEVFVMAAGVGDPRFWQNTVGPQPTANRRATQTTRVLRVL